jgi:hypothetical protein
MSQGEVNALALAVFLPRARLPASPFRFLVIDDPVQAMDPAKVDGLARVLDKAASDRQVIVFTHDNRLVQAVRQLRLPATVVHVGGLPGVCRYLGCKTCPRDGIGDRADDMDDGLLTIDQRQIDRAVRVQQACEREHRRPAEQTYERQA